MQKIICTRLTAFFSSILLITLLSSCSVYKSQGRNQFESAIPGKIVPQSYKDSTLEDLNENQNACWLQPANEALWHVTEGQKLSVKLISPQTVEVCEVKQ